ncbi:hypothetical protein [Halomonas sp. RT37]|uniref:HPt domain-containing protein n=1 Tax=Halomonas sp. RT37 TaxID=2950872 RepID=A0AAU7KC47_9GAMM
MSSESLERIARNKNVARAAARQLSMEQLQKLAEVVEEVIDQKRDEERQRQEEEMQKAQKLAEIREQITEAGLSLNDLVSEQPKRKRGRPPKNAK